MGRIGITIGSKCEATGHMGKGDFIRSFKRLLVYCF